MSDKTRELIPTNEQWKKLDVMDNIQLGNINPAIRFNNYVALCLMRLKLWMFVPCDEEGNVLEEPTQEEKEWAENDSLGAQISCSLKQYDFNGAKSMVIFEGFEIKIFDGVKLVINAEGKIMCAKLPNDEWVFNIYKTIQDLTKLGLTIRQEAAKEYDL